MQPFDILETCLYAENLEQTADFYGSVLGLRAFSRQPGRHVFFFCGRRVLLLFRPSATMDDSSLPRHGAVGAGHVAFAVRQRDLDAWEARLRACGVAIEKTVDWLEGGKSLYFRDPAGNSLELATPRIWGLDEVTFGMAPHKPDHGHD